MRPESLVMACILIASAMALLPLESAHAQPTAGSSTADVSPASSAVKLVQMSESTCSYVCSSGEAIVTLSGSARSGDMLVATVASDDLTNLVVFDTLGTRIGLGVRSISTSCATNTGTCQADIYWGVLASSGPDTITVSEGVSTRALRVQVWEFQGVDDLRAGVACSSGCRSTHYPASAVLIATAEIVSGAGSGFRWHPYAAWGAAGSEFKTTTKPGSTTFPFSTSVSGAEAGAVLVGTR